MTKESQSRPSFGLGFVPYILFLIALGLNDFLIAFRIKGRNLRIGKTFMFIKMK
jgi:hypothetical protein